MGKRSADPSCKRSIAIVVPNLIAAESGGVVSVAEFLLHVLLNSERYRPTLVSVAVSSKDQASTRLLSPSSWIKGVQTLEFEWKGKRSVHVGARLTEFEFQRYRSRPSLNNVLDRYDLVQIVAGTPAWAMLGKHVKAPVALQVATLAKVERETKLRCPNSFKLYWSKLMTIFTDRLDHEALRYVDHLFVENSWMHNYTVKKMGADKVSFAPPGVNVETFYPADNFPLDGFILSVGRFDDPRKNTGLLFRAYHTLSHLMADVPPLVLAGRTKPRVADWRVAEELGIADRISIYEDVSTTKLANLYRQARLFVLSSNEEGLGIVLLEAMATGLPVVSTRCGGPETIIDEGVSGYLVPLNAHQMLADKMLKLLRDNPVSIRMGLEGRAIVDKKYSLEAAGNAFLTVYDGLIG